MSISWEQGIILIREQIIKAKGLQSNNQINNAKFDAWKNTTKQYLIKIFGEDSENATILDGGYDFAFINGMKTEQQYYYDKLSEHIEMLNSCIEQLETELKLTTVVKEEKKNKVDKKKVFVVHGRNEKIRDSMFQFLRAIGVEPIEWIEAKKMTRKGSPYVGEILDSAFSVAQAILVLLTPDDLAVLKEEFRSPNDPVYETLLKAQARPNVIFEAGMALGSKEERTILIEFGDLRPFSDVMGRHIVRFNGSMESRLHLIEIMKSCGLDIITEGRQDWIKVGDFSIKESFKELEFKSEGIVKVGDELLYKLRIKNNGPNNHAFHYFNVSIKDSSGKILEIDTEELSKRTIYSFENRVELLKIKGEVERFNIGSFYNHFDIQSIPV